MPQILSSHAVSPLLLGQLREWFETEWDDVDPFAGPHPEIVIPTPVVAVDDQSSLLGGLAFTSAAKLGWQVVGLDAARRETILTKVLVGD